MVTGLMVIVFASVALVCVVCGLRRDLTGPQLTPVSEATWWVSLGALAVYAAAGWLSGSHDQWAESLPAVLVLALVEAACFVTMATDTVTEVLDARRRRR